MKADNQWNADLYDRQHSFVWQFGAELVEQLSPQSGERILDLGCGTGHLTREIASRGAVAIGIDSSPTMIAQARQSYPQLQFEVADARHLSFVGEFDAVFSNAVLHWIPEAEAVVAGVWKSLKPGGRFVAEFGGTGNVAAIIVALDRAIQTAGYPISPAGHSWYFPSIAEYATVLESQGFEVTFAALFDRPTALEDGERGIQNWLEMFASGLFEGIPAEAKLEIMAIAEKELRPQLYQKGIWYADYRRIRVVSRKFGREPQNRD